MAWMALGGTLKRIPSDIMHQVEATRVLGEPRLNVSYLPGANDGSANMLNLAKGLCSVVLPEPGNYYYFNNYSPVKGGAYPPYDATDAPFITGNGDKEMWLTLCGRFSRPVVRVYGVYLGAVQITALYYGENYPATASVLDDKKVQQIGLHPEKNAYPACLDPAALSDSNFPGLPKDLPLPPCPTAFLAASDNLMWTSTRGVPTQAMKDNVTQWKLSGAIATGMAVFSFLQSGGAQVPIKPYYNECQLLK
jgi:hypothetical protein